MISNAIKSLMNNKANGVIRKMFTEAQKMRSEGKTVYDFTLGNPDLQVPCELNDAIILHSKDNHGYMQNAGYDFARQAMADKTNFEQMKNEDASNFNKITKDNIVMSVGAAGALNCIFKAIIDAGDEVIVMAPFFGEYARYAENVGGRLIVVKTKEDFHLDINAIKSVLTARTKIILLNSPNNPTGVVYTKSELVSLTSLLKDFYKDEFLSCMPYIVLDEPYRAITYDNASVSAIFPLYERAIIATSFAKNLSIPGERIGYIAVNNESGAQELVSAITLATRILGFVNAPALMQRVIADTWQVKVDYSRYENRRTLIMDILNDAGLEYVRPCGAFYIFPKVPDWAGGDDMAFCEHLKKYGILCAPGVGFGMSGYFRIAYCVNEDTIKNSRDSWLMACKK